MCEIIVLTPLHKANNKKEAELKQGDRDLCLGVDLRRTFGNPAAGLANASLRLKFI